MGSAPTRITALAVTLLAAAGCPPAETHQPVRPLPPVSAGKAHLRVFTEPAGARAIATTSDGYAVVVTDNGLERWDATGHVVASDALVARAIAQDNDTVVVATDTSIGHYRPFDDTYVELAEITDDATAIAPGDSDKEAWLGTAKGLFQITSEQLAEPLVTDAVKALARDDAGWLWIGTKNGVYGRKPTGDLVHLAPADGCTLVEVRAIVAAASNTVLAFGTDADGRERLAIGQGLTWTTYRTLPGVAFEAAVRRGTGVFALNHDRIYRIAPADGAVRPLSRDGMRLVPVAASAIGPPDWLIDPIDVVLPANALALGATDDALLIGTRDLGTARYRDADRHPHDWLRRRAMFSDATGLTVACTAREDCWLATGARRAWHWSGARFDADGPDDHILAVVRDPNNTVFAIHRHDGEPTTLHISRVDATTWTPLAKLTLTTPGDVAEISFAKFAASGRLWIGLRYREDDEPQSDGVAVVEPSSGRVTYRGGDRDTSRTKMPIPVGVVDADLQRTSGWFATDESVVHVAGTSATTWTDRDGLKPDIRALAVAPSGDVVVAARAGAGVWNGKSWSFPDVLRFEVNDVVATHSAVWLATERGVAAWDGRNIRRFDTFRGLAEDEVLDVATDQYDRVWARGPGSLTLISP